MGGKVAYDQQSNSTGDYKNARKESLASGQEINMRGLITEYNEQRKQHVWDTRKLHKPHNFQGFICGNELALSIGIANWSEWEGPGEGRNIEQYLFLVLFSVGFQMRTP